MGFGSNSTDPLFGVDVHFLWLAEFIIPFKTVTSDDYERTSIRVAVSAIKPKPKGLGVRIYASIDPSSHIAQSEDQTSSFWATSIISWINNTVRLAGGIDMDTGGVVYVYRRLNQVSFVVVFQGKFYISFVVNCARVEGWFIFTDRNQCLFLYFFELIENKESCCAGDYCRDPWTQDTKPLEGGFRVAYSCAESDAYQKHKNENAPARNVIYSNLFHGLLPLLRRKTSKHARSFHMQRFAFASWKRAA